jgi:hypothetical protein
MEKDVDAPRLTRWDIKVTVTHLLDKMKAKLNEINPDGQTLNQSSDRITDRWWPDFRCKTFFKDKVKRFLAALSCVSTSKKSVSHLSDSERALSRQKGIIERLIAKLATRSRSSSSFGPRFET